MVTIAADSEATRDERAKQAFFIVEPDRHQLVEIGRLLDAGKLRPVVDTEVPFSRASEAYPEPLRGKGVESWSSLLYNREAATRKVVQA